MIKFSRYWAMASANTFTIKPIKDFIELNLDDKEVIVDPFANTNLYGTIRNDLNPEYETCHYHMDALAFLKSLPSDSADMVLYDPPYSVSQASECYKSFGKEKLEVSVANAKYWSDCKYEVSRILKEGGVALCFGWNSNGIGDCNGMDLAEVMLIAHGGSHYDTICTKEIKRIKPFEELF